MLASLLAYDAAGNVVATRDFSVVRDEIGDVIGLLDYEAHEAAGGRLRDLWDVSDAVGSATWPEWLGGHAHQFTVELDPAPGQARAKIARLVHKQSGHKRERAAIEAEVAAAIAATPAGEATDLRALLGGPNRPLKLDKDGKNAPKVKAKRPSLPVVRRGKPEGT